MNPVKTVMAPVGAVLGTIVSLLVVLKVLQAAMPLILQSLGDIGSVTLTLAVVTAILSWVTSVAGLGS